MVGSASDTLDDGEAATIALALASNAVAASDDAKALALRARRFPSLIVASTIDLLAHDAVMAALGIEPLSDAIFAALKGARMRVVSHHEKWLLSLIGEERAKACPSLRGVVRLGPAKSC